MFTRPFLACFALLTACGGEPPDIYGFAHQCFTLHQAGRSLSQDGRGFAFDRGSPSTFYLQPSALGTYLLYDQDGGYLVAEEDGVLQRQTTLVSDVTLVDDTYVSGAEWEFVASGSRIHLKNRRTHRWLGRTGLLDEDATNGAAIRFTAADGCTAHPELTLDATGSVVRTTFEDGDLFGIVDTHGHLMSNWGFGGGGIFHGAPFHRLGVEHALGDCTASHGEEGTTDFIGFAFDQSSNPDGFDTTAVLGGLLNGSLPFPNHQTQGYPDFPDWPDAPRRSTHQTMYHKWLERAHLAGLRLLVMHATTNVVLCQLTAGAAGTPLRYPCDDMVAVDRMLDETYAMERYLDAQAGGPGEGWFRVVQSPEEARQVISSGKMAVILGIEVPDLFGCRLVQYDEGLVCDETHVITQLDAYYDRGVRALFPVHKFDNQFSAGDGDRNFIELGNFLNTGHYSNFVTGDCPDIRTPFDQGSVVFGGLNEPRDDYFAPPAEDMSEFADDPVATALPFLTRISEPALEGDYCQQAGLTDLGVFLLEQMMRRGMLVELDHLPRRSYIRAFDVLQTNNYPALGTHGFNHEGRVYELGGLSKTSIRQCRESGQPGELLASFRERTSLIEATGGYPAEGFGFDLNGFAGARRGRFADGVCPTAQEGPVTYPFTSWAGDVTFTAPQLGNRAVDFNQEGFIHIGMLPELLEDARIDAGSAEELEPLFRSAEGYIRMWERAEARGQAITAEQEGAG